MLIRSCVAGSSLAVVCVSAAFAQQPYIPVDFTSQFNGRVQDIGYCSPTYPVGPQVYGGVPFAVPLSGNNAWFSASGPTTLDIALNVSGAVAVHSIMNTFWGEQSNGTFARVEFFGSDGAYHRKDLDGNVDIRDYLNGFWTNFINATTTTNVFTSPASCSAGQTRLDKQRFELPVAFRTQRLVRVLFTDTGATTFQRIFVHGVTVETPCPRFDQPIADRAPCPTGTATLNATPAGVGPFTYLWELQDAGAPGGWRTLSDGQLIINGVSWGTIGGVGTAALQGTPIASSPLVSTPIFIRCTATNSCGSATSPAAKLSVCLADFTCSGTVDDLDFLVFVSAYNDLICASAVPGECPADMNRDGVVDDLDFQLFVPAYDRLLCD